VARVPKYPFRVVMHYKLGDRLVREQHNYENLAGAIAFREIALRKPRTVKIEVMVVLDESTPSHSV
jgi:hypothetical protein